MKRTIAAATIMIISAISMQASYPLVRHFSKHTYKAGTQTWSITEQPDGGAVYFANNDGLLEYDGISWECHPLANRTNVRSVFFDNENGRIYAGGYKEFGYYAVDNKAGIRYKTLVSGYDEEQMTEIWAIHKIGEHLYLRCDKAVYRYSEDGMERFPFNGKTDCSAVIRNTLVVSSVEGGIQMLLDGQFISLPSTEILKGVKISGIESVSEEKAVFVAESGEIYEYDWKETRRTSIPFMKSLGKQRIFCTASDKEWLALGSVGNGVFLHNNKTGESIHLDIDSGLQNNTVLSMRFDSTGNLWLGLDKGIDYIVVNSPERSLFRSDNIYGTGYTSAIYEGKLYLGTNQGLYYMDYPLDNSGRDDEIREVESLKGQVWFLDRIDGKLFCGHDTGLYTIQGGKVEKIDGVSGTWKVKKMRKVDDRIIGSSYSGMFFLKKVSGKWILDSYLKGFDQHSGRFEEDTDGKIWVYHWVTGLWRLTLAPDGISIGVNDYFGMNYGLPSDHNNLVSRYRNSIALSSDAGFYRYDKAADKVMPIKELNDIFPTPPKGFSIIESPCNDLFFLSKDMNGIAFSEPDGTYTLDTLSLKFLREKQIFGFEHFNFLDRNSILINTENGFSLVDLQKIRNATKSIHGKVFIKNIFTARNGNDSLIYSARRPDVLQKEIRLPYSENSVKFEFVCPQYAVENGIEYSYRLDGYDRNWSEFSTSGMKEYTNLPPATYTFNVRARSRYSDEISEASLTFSITPPWYGTIAAYILYSIIFFLFIYLLFRYSAYKSEERARRIASEKEVEIKILKSQNLEHDLKHKSQTLASSTMNVIRKNEILMQIQHDVSKTLQYIESSETAKSKRILHKIQHDIVENIEHDDYWTQFEANFDIVYEDYLKRLGEKYHSLTINDKKLCAYLKMGLCSKEIAPLLNLSVHSVEMARYRLRKKMGLSREHNLTDYLQHF